MSRESRLRLAWCGLHPARAKALVAKHGSAATVVQRICRGRIDTGERVRAAAATPEERIDEELTALGASAILRGEAGYPDHLADLPDAPDVMFVRGNLPDAPGVAIVGTRRCTAYGRGVARAYGAAVARAGWTLVSGLARGIDGEAHRGTVDGSGLGVAVLGSGIGAWYPAEHARLGESLLALGGAVLSEYPPGTPPEGWRFPPRNRIISGLAASVVVVEATETGGALITAARALEHGRPVLAVPGDIDRASSRGTNLLIRDGAVPVLESDDLVAALSLVLGPSRETRDRAVGDSVVDAVPVGGLTVAALTATLQLPVDEVLAAVARAETKGRLRQENGRVYGTGR